MSPARRPQLRATRRRRTTTARPASAATQADPAGARAGAASHPLLGELPGWAPWVCWVGPPSDVPAEPASSRATAASSPPPPPSSAPSSAPASCGVPASLAGQVPAAKLVRSESYSLNVSRSTSPLNADSEPVPVLCQNVYAFHALGTVGHDTP